MNQNEDSAQPILVLRYGNCRPVVTTQKQSLPDVEQTARQFFAFPASAKLKFSATFITGELMQIDPEVWPHIYTTVSSLWIEVTEPLIPEPLPIAISTLLDGSPSLQSRRLIHLSVRYWAKTIPVMIYSDDSVNALKRIVRDKEGIPPDQQQLIYMGQEMEEGDRLLRAYGVDQDSTIALAVKLRGAKPVIYLYPPSSTSVIVILSLVPSWEFSAIYPLAPVKIEPVTGRETISWDVFAEPSGQLRSSNGSQVSYLYWEAETRALPEIVTLPLSRSQTPGLESSTQRFDPAKPVLTPQNTVILRVPAELTKYLDHALLAMGLHTEARTSFITYWLPSFMKHENIALRFLEQSAYESAARLDITPSPDVVMRVFMLFRGVPSCDLAVWAEAEQRTNEMNITEWKTIVGVDVERMEREDLFRVLEWGGMEVRL